MQKIVHLTLAAFLLFGLAACTKPAQASELKSDKPRITSPATNQEDVSTLVQGNDAFALDLYKNLKNAEGNLFYSPYSISEALAMTYGGARTETETQMASTLKFQLPQSRSHPAFNSLDLALASRGQGAQGKDGKGFRLHVVNAIWGQQGFSFLPSYLDLLSQNYGAGLRILDFIKSAEPSRQTINQWVSDQTEAKIKDLLPPGSINADTRLVLTNAIYFNAAWASQFKPEATASGKFNLLNGSQIDIPFMKHTSSYGYVKGDNYQAVELPYDGRELSMVVMMPNADAFRGFETGLNSNQVKGIISAIKNQQVELWMPKFKIESEFSLKKELSAMGMPVAFSDAADFSGMDGKKDLTIMDVVHKAFVSVDETGTEAAAATGVIVGITSIPAEPLKVTIDRPFMFLIRDIKTGTILFIGRVVNPGS